jgi:Probable Zinc-ribbon domain
MQRPCSPTSRKFCSNESCTICLEKSFASHPRAKFWCQEKNSVDPRHVSKGSGKKFWFKCGECNHQFDARLDNISDDHWCPYCSVPPKRLCEDDNCEICLERSFASHPRAKFWCQEKNTVDPRHVSKCSRKKFWFKCGECNHVFEATLSSISCGDQWCPYCSGNKLCENTTCNICHEKSFASHPRAKFWCQEKNAANPRYVFKSSHKKYWFKCGKCHHLFDSTLGSISCGDQWCPYCSGNRLCGDSACDSCHQKSFASHPRVKFWCQEKNSVNPRQLFKCSNKKYWFKCEECHHVFEAQLNSISNDTWCPYCSVPPKRLCEDDNCKICFDKSFASHPRAKFWDYDKNAKKPRAVFKASDKKYHFICDQGHRSKKRACEVNNETIKQWCEYCNKCPSCGLWRTLGKVCSYCKPKNRNALYVKTKEYQVVKFLRDVLPDVDFIHNKSVGKDCTNGHLFPDIRYDCVIGKDESIIPYHLIVEVDEFQHRGASYKCDQQRMHDIVAKLEAPCIFIRYNPDSTLDDTLTVLSKRVKKYLHLKKPVWDDVSALFVTYIGYK